MATFAVIFKRIPSNYYCIEMPTYNSQMSVFLTIFAIMKHDEIFSYRFSSKIVNPTVQVCSCSKLGRHIAYRWPDYATTGLKCLFASVISFPIIVVPIIKVWLPNITWISIWNKLSKICILIMVDCVPITYEGCLV